MLKESSKKILASSIALLIGLGSTALAAPKSDVERSQEPDKKIDHRYLGHKDHRGFSPKKLASIKELGLTEKEIIAGSKANKTLFDLAKEKKGLSSEQVKSILIKRRTEAINQKVSEGKITKEKAEVIIPKMKNRIENWDGNLTPHKFPQKNNQ